MKTVDFQSYWTAYGSSERIFGYDYHYDITRLVGENLTRLVTGGVWNPVANPLSRAVGRVNSKPYGDSNVIEAFYEDR